MNHRPLGFPFSGIARTMSDLPGDSIAKLRNLTSGSRVSENPGDIKHLVVTEKDQAIEIQKSKNRVIWLMQW